MPRTGNEWAGNTSAEASIRTIASVALDDRAWLQEKLLVTAGTRSFTAFRNELPKNDSFPSAWEQNISGRVLPVVTADRFIQPPHLMVECIEWSHEYMTAGNKPSYIDDAVNSVISSFPQPEKGIPEMPYILAMSILYHSQQCPPVIACILSIECSGLIGDAPYAYVEMQNLHMDSLSSVRLKVILLDSLPLLRGKNSGRILRKQGSLLLDSPLSKRDLKKLVSPGQVEHAVLKVSHKKIILTARSVRGDDSYWGDLTYALSQKYFPGH